MPQGKTEMTLSLPSHYPHAPVPQLPVAIDYPAAILLCAYF